MSIKSHGRSRIAKCLGCDSPLGRLQVLLGHHFCSAQHQRDYADKVNAATLVRLQEVEERLNATRSSAEPRPQLDTFPVSG